MRHTPFTAKHPFVILNPLDAVVVPVIVKSPIVEEPKSELLEKRLLEDAVVANDEEDVAPPVTYTSPAIERSANGDVVPTPTFPPLNMAAYVFCAPAVVYTARPNELVVEAFNIVEAVDEPMRSEYAFVVVALELANGGAAMPTVARSVNTFVPFAYAVNVSTGWVKNVSR